LPIKAVSPVFSIDETPTHQRGETMSNPSSPTPSNRFPVWFLLLVAIGFPSAAGFTFAQTITQHPLQALGIALLYEILSTW
jgi:hypothetical protein